MLRVIFLLLPNLIYLLLVGINLIKKRRIKMEKDSCIVCGTPCRDSGLVCERCWITIQRRAEVRLKKDFISKLCGEKEVSDEK